MSQITRTWLGFAAIGAGLIHLALVISTPLPIAIALGGLGLAETVWGVLALAKDTLPVPRTAQAVAIAPVIAWSLLVVLSTLLATPQLSSALPLVPMIIAMVFQLFAAATIGVHLRRASMPGEQQTPALPSAGRYLLALTVGGVLVGGLTTPALALTEAGRFAQPHGQHSADFVPTPADAGQIAQFEQSGHTAH